MQKKFNEQYVAEHSKEHPSGLAKIIIDMNENNVRESVAILKINNAFKHSSQRDFIKLRSESNPEFKDTFGYKIYSLLRDFSLLNSSYDTKIDINNTDLWNEFFPMTAANIFHRARNGLVEINKLHQAAFKAKIKSSPETFNQYCKEVELLFISQGVSMQDDVVVCDTELYQDFIEKINESYEPISKYSPFGWKAFRYSMFEEKINEVGCDKFIKIINSKKKSEGLFVGFDDEKNDISGGANILSHSIKCELVEAIKKVPTNKIGLNLLLFVTLLCDEEPAIRKNSEIIRHLPKLKDSEFPNLEDRRTPHTTKWLEIGEFFKMSEIELGINDVRPEYANNNRVWGFNKNFFGKEPITRLKLELEFIQTYFSVSDNKAKQLAIKELIVDIFKYNSEFVNVEGSSGAGLYDHTVFCPQYVRENLHFSTKILLLTDFLKDAIQQNYLKEIFIVDKYLNVFLTPDSAMKKTVLDLNTDEDKNRVDFCFNVMINHFLYERKTFEQDELYRAASREAFE